MIGLKTFAENLQTKLNNNLQGLTFAIKADTKEFEKSLRIGNTVKEYINGLLTLQSSDMSNLTDGQLFATIGCRLQVIFKLKGNESDEDTEIIDPDTNEVVEIIEGNYSKIERVRDALSSAFQTNTQEVMTDSAGKNYLVCTLYQFIETGNREQVQILGDSMSFTAYISYMIVENGINTHDIVYTLDGKVIPFQTNTAYRTPTMDANVPANSPNGATKNLSSQSNFNVSFQLPALQNAITRAMFKWLFGGELNTAHLLNVSYLETTGAYTEKNYLVTFGENTASGETIKNVGQTMSLVECWDDYEIINIPDTFFVYERTGAAVSTLTFYSESYFYDFNTKQFGHVPIEQSVNFTVNNGDFLISTAPLNSTNGFEILQSPNNNIASITLKFDANSGKLIVTYPHSYLGTTLRIDGNKMIAVYSTVSADLRIENGKLILTR